MYLFNTFKLESTQSGILREQNFAKCNYTGNVRIVCIVIFHKILLLLYLSSFLFVFMFICCHFLCSFFLFLFANSFLKHKIKYRFYSTSASVIVTVA